MHTRIIHNHRLLDASKTRLPAISSATLYGRGVFTTLAVYNSRPFLWPLHWARLKEHAARAGVSCDAFDSEAIEASLARLVAANKVSDGRARVTLLARDLRGHWQTATTAGDGAKAKPKDAAAATTTTDLLIITGDARPPRDADGGLALTVSPHRANTHSPLAGIKSVNYLEHLIALEEARARDFDEAIVLNERGEVVSATMANVFFVTKGTLHAPALSTGALAGTTRALVLDLAEELAVPHTEGVYDLAHLGDADEIFLTSAGLGVAIVNAFDFHRYTVAAGSVALRLREAFRQMTLGSG